MRTSVILLMILEFKIRIFILTPFILSNYFYDFDDQYVRVCVRDRVHDCADAHDCDRDYNCSLIKQVFDSRNY